MQECVFCRIMRGEIPVTIVFEDEWSLAFMDIGSVNPGHMLVATRAHVDNIYGLEPQLAAAVFSTATRVAQAAKRALNCQGLSLFQANEAAGAQTVMHFHVHVLPRWENDGMTLGWPVKNPPRDELEEAAGRIRAAL